MMSENWKYLSRQLGIIALVLVVAFIIFCLGLVILSPDTWKELISKFTGQ